MAKLIRLQVWHTTEHDNADVTLVETKQWTSKEEFVNKIMRDGGFWLDSAFIPWHKINYIQEVTY